MKTFIEIKGKIIEVATRLWPYLVYILKFIAALVLFQKINTLFGGNIEILGRKYVPVLLAGVSVFLNLATIGVIALAYMVAHMLGISWILALVTLVLGTFFIAAALYFNRGTAGLVWILPLLSQMGIPCAAPMACGLFCPVTACGGVAVGTITTYFLRAVIGYLPTMGDEDSTVTALDIFIDQVVSNSSFYILMIAMVLMTVVIYLVGLIRIRGAKLYALVMGLVVEILVQYAGKLFFNTGVDMGGVMKSAWYVFLLGLVLVFFTSDGNYNRIEKVRFEDDDYIYHVRAIPKAKITKAHKKVKNVTRDTSKMDLTANLGAVVEVGREVSADKSSPDERRQREADRAKAEERRRAEARRKKRAQAMGQKPAGGASGKTGAAMDFVKGLIPKGMSQPKKRSSQNTQKSRPMTADETADQMDAMMRSFDEAPVSEKKEGQRDNQNLNITDL